MVMLADIYSCIYITPGSIYVFFCFFFVGAGPSTIELYPFLSFQFIFNVCPDLPDPPCAPRAEQRQTRARVGWVRQTRVSWVRRIFLVLFTFSSTYLATCLFFSGTWNLIPVLGKPPNQGTVFVGVFPGSCRTAECCVVAGTRESGEIGGAKRGEREGVFCREWPKVDDEVRREEETRPRRTVEEARKEDEKERSKHKWEFWGREERGDMPKNGRQDSASDEAAAEDGADVDAAETERERVRLMNEKGREAAAATKVEEVGDRVPLWMPPSAGGVMLPSSVHRVKLKFTVSQTPEMEFSKHGRVSF